MQMFKEQEECLLKNCDSGPMSQQNQTASL
jgi:hypothetical protein